MTKSKLNISAIQTSLVWQDVSANLSHFEQLLANCQEQDIIVLPEMFATGFSMQSERVAADNGGQALEWMQQQAEKNQSALVGSLAVKDNYQYVNRCYFVQPDGKVSHYDKRHLFRMGNEHQHYQAGAERVIVNYQGWRVCLQICYDLRFPVFSRNKNDYDVLIYVANWPAARAYAWSSLLVARAIENQAYVIGVNRVGDDGKDVAHSGDSIILDFMGQSLAAATPNRHQLIKASLNHEELHAFRQRFPAHLDADKFEMV